MDGSRGHYAKWNKSDRDGKNITWSHLYVESKSKKLKQTKKKKKAHGYSEQVGGCPRCSSQEEWVIGLKGSKFQL